MQALIWLQMTCACETPTVTPTTPENSNFCVSRNELSASVISQRLREGDRAAAFIPELRGNLGQQPRGERELREWHALIDLLSGAVAPRKVFLKIDELYDPVKGDWSQALRSPGIQECRLIGNRIHLERAIGREKKSLG